MDEQEIENFFSSVVDHSSQNPMAVKAVFSVLIRATLKYRDETLSSSDLVVTVEDVRTALGWLVPVLTTGNMPETDNEMCLGLLKSWLEELKRLEEIGPLDHLGKQD